MNFQIDKYKKKILKMLYFSEKWKYKFNFFLNHILIIYSIFQVFGEILLENEDNWFYKNFSWDFGFFYFLNIVN